MGNLLIGSRVALSIADALNYERRRARIVAIEPRLLCRRSMRYPNRIRTPASAARRARPIDHDLKVKQRHQRVIGLVALSRQVHGKTFEITERAVSQSTLVSRTQDDAGCLVSLESFLPARCA